MSIKTLNFKHSGHYGINEHVKKPGFLASVGQTLLTWQDRASMRYRLANMDKENLSDIGLSAKQVSVETHKLFWQN